MNSDSKQSQLEWTVALPTGAQCVRVSPPPECSSMAHLRGELLPGAPFFGVVSTRWRDGSSIDDFVAELATVIVGRGHGHEFEVRGCRRGWRLDGLIEMDEGLTADGVERITIVTGEGTEEFVSLTVRTRPEDAVAESVEEVLTSFRVGS